MPDEYGEWTLDDEAEALDGPVMEMENIANKWNNFLNQKEKVDLLEDALNNMPSSTIREMAKMDYYTMFQVADFDSEFDWDIKEKANDVLTSLNEKQCKKRGLGWAEGLGMCWWTQEGADKIDAEADAEQARDEREFNRGMARAFRIDR